MRIFIIIILLIVAFVSSVWIIVEERKNFSQQKREVLEQLIQERQTRIDVYQNIIQLQKMFVFEVKKKQGKKYNLEVFTTIRDEIIQAHSQFFHVTKSSWKYYPDREKIIEMHGPFSELGKNIADVDINTIRTLYGQISFQQENQTAKHTYDQITQLKEMFVSKTHDLESIVYVRNEIMKNYSFYFTLDHKTQWSQETETKQFSLTGPFDTTGIEIGTP